MVSRRSLLAGLAAAAAIPSRAARAIAPARVLRAPFTLQGDRVLLSVAVNGAAPVPFVLDTGGVVGLIRDDVAKRMKLPVLRQSRLGGVGGPGSFPLYKLDAVVIGGAWRQDAIVLAGAGAMGFGQDAAGSLAAGLLTTRDSDLDFDRGEVRIYPEGRGARDGFARVPSRIEQRGATGGSAYIFADAVLDGKSYRFVVDTGAPRGLTLFADAARRSGLLDDARPFAPLHVGGLGGGGPLGRIVRADRLAFGGRTFERPLVMLAGAKTGYALEDGIIGLALLRHFNLSIDTRDHVLWVQPSQQPPVSIAYGLSGLWAVAHKGATVVEAVGTASPAAQAGIRVGDRIVGEPFAATIAKLTAPEGAPCPLAIERDGVRRDVTLELRRFL